MTDEENENNRTTFNRRRFLKGLSAGILAGALATQTGGAEEELRSYDFVATPMGLSEEGEEYLGYTEPELRVLEEKRQVEVNGVEREVKTETIVTRYGSIEEGTPDWKEDGRETRGLGLISTPQAKIDFEETNPYSEISSNEFVTGERGHELLRNTGLIGEREWLRRPEHVMSAESEVLDEEVGVESYLGITESSEHRGVGVLINVSKVETQKDSVFVFTVHKHVVPEEFSVDESQLIGTEEEVEKAEALLTRETLEHKIDFRRGLDSSVTPYPGKYLSSLGLNDVKLVQKVTDTKVYDPSKSSKPPGNRIIYEESSEPPLVEGDNTAPVFELNGKNVDQIPVQKVRVEVIRKYSRASTVTDSFTVPKSEIKNIVGNGLDTLVVLHEISNDSDSNQVPVFPIDDRGKLESVTVRVGSGSSVLGDKKKLKRGQDFRVKEIEPLRVGFVPIHDSTGGNNYGDANGEVMKYKESVEVAVELLNHILPGKINAFRYDVPVKGTKNNNTNNNSQMLKDFREAKTSVENNILKGLQKGKGQLVSMAKGKPGTGASWAAFHDLKNNGFDVVMAIVPGDRSPKNSLTNNYFEFHTNRQGLGGISIHGCSHAAASLEVGEIGEEKCAETVAHEATHKLLTKPYEHPGGQNHPLAQRKPLNFETWVNVGGNTRYIDFDHARHQNSDNDNNTSINTPPDPPGVRSTGFDLTDGSFKTVNGFSFNSSNELVIEGPKNSPTIKPPYKYVVNAPSYMSYTQNKSITWTDERIHKNFVYSEFACKAKTRSEILDSISVVGEIVDDHIDIDLVHPYKGLLHDDGEEDNSGEGEILVELEDSRGEIINRIQHSDTVEVYDGESIEGVVSFVTEFPKNTAQIRVTHGEKETEINPISRSLADAVERVPDKGFRENSENLRGEMREYIEGVNRLMEENRFEEAAVLVEEMKGAIDEWVNEDYETYLNEYTKSEVLGTVEEMFGRLKKLEENL